MLSDLPMPCLGQATCSPLPAVQTSLPFVRTQAAVLRHADSQATLLAASCSSTGHSQLFHISLPDHAVRTIPLEATSALVVAGADGKAYLGTSNGRILCLDPNTLTLQPVGTPLVNEQITAGLSSATGRIFFGTSPGGMLLTIDPHSGTMAPYDIDPAHSTPQHVRAFVDLPDGGVAAWLDGMCPAALRYDPASDTWTRIAISGLAGEHGIVSVVSYDERHLLACTQPGRRFFLLDAGTLQVSATLPPLPEDDSVYCLQRVEDSVLASGLSGAFYRFVVDRWERLGFPLPGDPLQFTAWANGQIAGVSYHGRLVQSTADQRMYTIFPLPTRAVNGLTIAAMGMAPDRKLYFSFAENMRLGCWDPEEDDLSQPFVAAPTVGEISALGFAGERLLIGFGPSCGVMGLYPELSYRLMENPRFIGAAGYEMRRPIGPMVHHENNVYFASASTSPQHDGAIMRLNPLENEITPFTGIIPRQNLTSLVADRLSGLLVAGGRIPHPSQRAGCAHLALWSPYQEETVRQVTPFPDAQAVRVWAAEGGRIYVTDNGARLAILSSEGDVLERGEFPLGAITALITNQDGKLYGLAGGWLFHIDPEEQTVERLVEAQGTLLVEVRRGQFAFTDAGRIYTVQLW